MVDPACLEAKNAKVNRTLVIIAIVALAVVFIVGVTTVTLQVRENRRAAEDRAELKMLSREMKDCTTPKEPASACQQRLVEANKPVQRAASEDNLRASIAVGSCLREQAPDVEGCALTKFRAAVEAADAAQTPPR